MIVARAPAASFRTLRVVTRRPSAPARTKMSSRGFVGFARSSIPTTAPSVMNAVLSATTASWRAASSPISPAPVRSAGPASAAASGWMVTSSRPAADESCGACTPSTKTTRCASSPASAPSAASISATVTWAGAPTAGGSASFRATRRSVYFHSSMRRCGSPSAAKAPMAALRASATARPPGSFAATASKFRVRACSALVLGAATVIHAPPERLPAFSALERFSQAAFVNSA